MVQPSASTAPVVPLRARITVLAGGDVELARAMGKALLANPTHDPFRHLKGWLGAADLRFANLECQLSEQRGETQSPVNPLVFTGPPIGADTLARARFDVVSTANNHAWDYGAKAMVETLDNLDRVGIAHCGTSRTPGGAEAPAVLTVGGVRVAFLAFTAIWNQGPLSQHEARDRVAAGDEATMTRAVRAVRAAGNADVVIVSFHGGQDYEGAPLEGVRRALRAVIDAGADAVVSHHAHVMQSIELRDGKPILYGLGNLAMHMHRDHPWTEFGYLARLGVGPGVTPTLAVCPYRIDGGEPVPLTDARRIGMHLDRLRAVSRPVALEFGAEDDGCFPVSTTAPR